MSRPFFSCICPTYKRPEMLRNAIACFLSQTAVQDAELIVLDDAGQWDSRDYGNFHVVSLERRFQTLPDKFNSLVAMCRGEVVVVWEDDDIYLPRHLEVIGNANPPTEHQYYTQGNVYSNYQMPFGQVRTESAIGRFHGSWAYSSKLLAAIGGYKNTASLDFDMQMRGRILKRFQETVLVVGLPTYVYRWGSGDYNGSQSGPEQYASFWRKLERIPAPYIGELKPEFDKETIAILDFLKIAKANWSAR